MIRFTLLSVFLLLTGCISTNHLSNPAKPELLNEGFELKEDNLPANWFLPQVKGYTAALDSAFVRQGRYSLRVSATSAKEGNSYQQVTNFFPAPKQGKSLRIVADVMTRNVSDGAAGLWAKVNRAGGNHSLENLEIKDATGWGEYSISIPLDSATGNVTFGGFLMGTGDAWFDSFRVYVDGELYQHRYYSRFKPVTRPEVRALNRAILPIKRTSPSGDDSDLAFLQDITMGKRIIALGEGTHGTAEFFRLKHRIIRYLVEEQGFNVFSMEANMPEAYQVNGLLNSPGKADSIEWDGLGFWVWKTREIADMVKWMKTYNQGKPAQPLLFTGFDSQFPLLPISTLKAYADRHDGSLSADLLRLEAICLELEREIRSHSVPEGKALEIDRLSQSIFTQLRKSLDRHKEALDKQELEWLLQNGRVLVQIAGLNSSPREYVYRDSVMAENISWILNSVPNSRMIVWGHNGHIKKSGTSMGKRLSERFGEEYYALGLTTQEGTYTGRKLDSGRIGSDNTLVPGEFDSYEYFFSQARHDNFFLDLAAAKKHKGLGRLKRAHRFRLLGSAATLSQFSSGSIMDDFDGLIFLKSTSASELLNRQSGQNTRAK